MRRTTRRRFLGLAAGSVAGTFVWTSVCAGAAGLFAGMGTALAADFRLNTSFPADLTPHMQFPAAARERIAIASYPFRDFIAGREEKVGGGGKLELKDFAAHVSEKFDIKKIEPWSAHFRSLEKAYLEELRAAVEK